MAKALGSQEHRGGQVRLRLDQHDRKARQDQADTNPFQVPDRSGLGKEPGQVEHCEELGEFRRLRDSRARAGTSGSPR